ncbi:hypothetical protein J6590_014294 [Homalodisca vitripennis]|nr:hypothetical protein J6590_014294 [Homalodisca vitripennis]
MATSGTVNRPHHPVQVGLLAMIALWTRPSPPRDSGLCTRRCVISGERDLVRSLVSYYRGSEELFDFSHTHTQALVLSPLSGLVLFSFPLLCTCTFSAIVFQVQKQISVCHLDFNIFFIKKGRELDP